MSQHTHIVGAKQGRQDAFDSLYQWLLPQIYRYALAQTGDRAAAEDIVSESFMAMVNSLQTLPDHDIAVLAWMRTVSRRRSIDWIRRQTVHREAMSKLTGGRPSETEDPRYEHDRKDTVREVRRVLGGLPHEYREVLELRYLDGRSLACISEALNQSVSAINSLLYRARAAFRGQFDRISNALSEEGSDSSGEVLLVEIDHD